MRLRKFWGWGYADEILSDQEESQIEKRILQTFGVDKVDTLEIPKVSDIDLPSSRISIPNALKEFLSDDVEERLNHAYGKSFPDVARALLKDFSSPPDLVAFPDSENDLNNIVDWADENNIAVIPYGGGSSVCGGVETSVSEDYSGVISLDLRNLNKILEIDKESRAARIQAGILGPDLESALKEHNLTMRHYPQSCE